MFITHTFWDRLRWIGCSESSDEAVLKILRHRFADEKRSAERLKQHAEKMHYPQFRETLFRIAAEEAKHADWIAEKITALGGELPIIANRPREQGLNSWRYLRDDLEEERRCGAELEEEVLMIQEKYPAVSELLSRIAAEEHRHRDEIRSMLMRSDPQALYSA
jgi:bacterioferritin (cytochrome b1)